MHASKNVIYEIFVNVHGNGAVLSFIVFSKLYIPYAPVGFLSVVVFLYILQLWNSFVDSQCRTFLASLIVDLYCLLLSNTMMCTKA